MSLESDDLLWSKDLIKMHGTEKVQGRLSIHSRKMIFEERVENMGKDPGWRSKLVTILPSANDIRIEKKGFFKKVIMIKIDEQDQEFYTISEETERTFQEIISALKIAKGLCSSSNQGILNGIIKTGSILAN